MTSDSLAGSDLSAVGLVERYGSAGLFRFLLYDVVCHFPPFYDRHTPQPYDTKLWGARARLILSEGASCARESLGFSQIIRHRKMRIGQLCFGLVIIQAEAALFISALNVISAFLDIVDPQKRRTAVGA